MKINSSNEVIIEFEDIKYFYFNFRPHNLDKEEEKQQMEEFAITINKRLTRFAQSKKSENTKKWAVRLIEYLWHYTSDEKTTPFLWVKLEDIKRDLMYKRERKIGRPKNVAADHVLKGKKRKIDLSTDEIKRINKQYRRPNEEILVDNKTWERTLRQILADLTRQRFLHRKQPSPKKIFYRLNAEAFISDIHSIYQDFFDSPEEILAAKREELSLAPKGDVFLRLEAAIGVLKERGISDPKKEINEYILKNFLTPREARALKDLKEYFKEDYMAAGKSEETAEFLASTVAWGW